MSKKEINIDNFSIETENIEDLKQKNDILVEKYIKMIQNKLKNKDLKLKNEEDLNVIRQNLYHLLNTKHINEVAQIVKKIKYNKNCLELNDKKFDTEKNVATITNFVSCTQLPYIETPFIHNLILRHIIERDKEIMWTYFS